ncbi:MAG: hypothetical protein R8N50_04325 [Alphaproteobacteria bacterium]|nr:hypothetical protein [Alphaproteobacteria bacterium]
MKHNKVYYYKLYFNQVLPQVTEVTNQSEFGYHGLSHTNQVAMFGIDLAYSINQEVLPVLLAAGLHDCARTNDEWCIEHGPQAALVAWNLLNKYYPNMSRETVRKILFAIENHTIGRTAPDGVSACLWDGDRIRLSWENTFRPEFFNTARGHKIASMSPENQKRYINAQNAFLIRNQIKTRDQIEFEQMQNALYYSRGTNFSNKIR